MEENRCPGWGAEPLGSRRGARPSPRRRSSATRCGRCGRWIGGGSVCTSPALAPTPWAPIRAACTPGFPPHQPQLRLGVGGGAPAPPPSIPPKVLPGTRVPRRGWPSPCPAFCLWGFSLVGAGLFWRGEEGRDLPDPLIGEGSCPHRKQSFQSQPLHYLAGPAGPRGPGGRRGGHSEAQGQEAADRR